MTQTISLPGFTEATHGLLYTNPKPHVRSQQAYFPSIIAFDAQHLGACVTLGQAFEASDLHLVYFESRDGGASWRRISNITTPTPDESSSTVGRMSLLPDGTLYTLITRHERSPDDNGLTLGESIAMRPMTVEKRLSLDQGATWQEAEGVDLPEWLEATAYEMCSPLVELSDGRTLWPTSTWPTTTPVTPDRFQTGAFLSHDHGKSWGEWLPLWPNDRYIYWEAKVLEWGTGLLALAWTFDLEHGCDLPNHYLLCDSKGRALGAPASTGLQGQTLSALSLGEGQVLCVYRRVDQPGLWAAIAQVDENGWETQAQICLWGAPTGASAEPDAIRQHFATLKFGAPTLQRLPDGRVHIAFWAVEQHVSGIRTITLT